MEFVKKVAVIEAAAAQRQMVCCLPEFFLLPRAPLEVCPVVASGVQMQIEMI